MNMNYILSTLILVLCMVVAYQIFMNYLTQKQSRERNIAALTFAYKNYEAERNEWVRERQQLLDRIQAPSFDHLKQAEIRLVKAQKEEPAVKYELV